MGPPGGALDGSVAMVTGCGRGRGLGRSIALALAADGADLAITDIDPGGSRNTGERGDAARDGLHALAAEIEAMGRRVSMHLGDVADTADAQSMIDGAVDSHGHLDILVNNAAAPHGADRELTWLVPPEAFDTVMRINVRGVFAMSAAVVRHLLAREAPGRIVNIASVAGRVGYPARSAYCASKFAVIGLTQVMAQELAGHRITVNAVCPGAIDTDRNAATRARAETSGDAGAGRAHTSPVGRLGQPTDIARTVRFLVDPDAEYMTGQSVVVDGGLYMA